jgi:hypothetical protein
VHWLDFNKGILTLEMHGTNIKIKKKTKINRLSFIVPSVSAFLGLSELSTTNANKYEPSYLKCSEHITIELISQSRILNNTKHNKLGMYYAYVRTDCDK